MKPMRKSVVRLIIAMGVTLTSAMVYGQEVITPGPGNENGPAPMQQEQASPGMSQGQVGGVGATVAPELSGVVSGKSLDRPVETPGPAPEELTGQPE